MPTLYRLPKMQLEQLVLGWHDLCIDDSDSRYQKCVDHKLTFVYRLNQLRNWESISAGMFLGVMMVTFVLTAVVVTDTGIFERTELK